MNIYDVLIWEYLKRPWENLELKNNMLLKDNYLFSQEDNKKEVIDNLYSIDYFYNLDKNIWNDDYILDLENNLTEVLEKMEVLWVKIDSKKLIKIWEKLDLDIKKEENIIYEISQEKFNINSPKQVWVILFEKMWLPFSKKTKTWYSVDNEVLEELSIKFPIAKHINNYRQYSKLKSTYVNWFLDIIREETSTVHTTYSQTIASTWRLSSINPNLQNIPSSNTWTASMIREVFVPFDDESEILSIDYSQIEVRVLAILSGDQDLLWAFLSWVDIHSNTWYFLFGKDELSIEERRISKRVNFGVIYGISPFWLSKMIWIPQKESKEYITKFFEKYSWVWLFFDNIIKNCEKTWYVETVFWRKRYIKWINDSNEIIRKWATREAINMPIQGTRADIIKIAMIEIDKLLKNYETKMIMQVHDELVFNVKKNEKDILLPKIIEIMENIFITTKKYDFKLKVDYAIWNNWKECK